MLWTSHPLRLLISAAWVRERYSLRWLIEGTVDGGQEMPGGCLKLQLYLWKAQGLDKCISNFGALEWGEEGFSYEKPQLNRWYS